MNSSLVLKSSTFENGKYQHFFAGDFAQGSRAGKGDLAKYCSFHENWVPLLEFSSAFLQPFSPLWNWLSFCHYMGPVELFSLVMAQLPLWQHPDTIQTTPRHHPDRQYWKALGEKAVVAWYSTSWDFLTCFATIIPLTTDRHHPDTTDTPSSPDRQYWKELGDKTAAEHCYTKLTFPYLFDTITL